MLKSKSTFSFAFLFFQLAFSAWNFLFDVKKYALKSSKQQPLASGKFKALDWTSKSIFNKKILQDFEEILQDFEDILQDFEEILQDFQELLQDVEAILQDFQAKWAYHCKWVSVQLKLRGKWVGLCSEGTTKLDIIWSSSPWTELSSSTELSSWKCGGGLNGPQVFHNWRQIFMS